ncbi:hypothetical protein BSKO_04866 [Bryopsis sp. KO-2023]|nr:hypothetical protein BSKO_04866 [Bryopsis sp. KO-2023]
MPLNRKDALGVIVVLPLIDCSLCSRAARGSCTAKRSRELGSRLNYAPKIAMGMRSSLSLLDACVGLQRNLESNLLLQDGERARLHRVILQACEEIEKLKEKLADQSKLESLVEQKHSLEERCKSIGRICQQEDRHMGKFSKTIDDYCSKFGENSKELQRDFEQMLESRNSSAEEAKLTELEKKLEEARMRAVELTDQNVALSSTLQSSRASNSGIERKINECRKPRELKHPKQEDDVRRSRDELASLVKQRENNHTRIAKLKEENKRLKEEAIAVELKIEEAGSTLFHLSGADEREL